MSRKSKKTLSAYQARRKLRRTKKRIRGLKQEVSKQDRKLETLHYHKRVVELSNELADVIPDEFPKDDPKRSLENIGQLIDLVTRVNWNLSQTPPDPSWPASKQYTHEATVMQPFLSLLTPCKHLTEFLSVNSFYTWYAFCTEQHIRHKRLPPSKGCKYWTVRQATDHYVSYVQQLWTLTNWKRYGRTFRTTQLLTGAFSAADIRVGAEFLKPPFPLMLFELPKRFVVDEGGTKMPVSGLVVAHDDVSVPNEVRLTIIGIIASTESPRVLYSVPFGEGETIQEDIELLVRDLTSYLPDDVSVQDRDSTQHPVYQIVNFVCNAILYCASFPTDMIPHNEEKLAKLRKRIARGGKKVANARKKLVKAQSESIYILGRHFTLDDERASEELDTDTPRKSLHIVRGHWRNQAHGPKHSLRKLIFIQPFWKGTGKPGPVKKYVVK